MDLGFLASDLQTLDSLIQVHLFGTHHLTDEELVMVDCCIDCFSVAGIKHSTMSWLLAASAHTLALEQSQPLSWGTPSCLGSSHGSMEGVREMRKQLMRLRAAKVKRRKEVGIETKRD